MAHPLREDNVGRAAGWLLLGLAGGLGLDLCGKYLLGTYPLVQFIFLRTLAGLLFFLVLGPLLGGWRRLVTRAWRWHLLRTVLATGSMFGFFFGLANMPLVNALSLGFTAPLMLTALSVPLLGEQVGWRRWVAVLAGFAGVLVILKPGTDMPTIPALAILASAFFYALISITSRSLGPTESSYSLSVYVMIGPLAVSSLWLAAGGSWLPPDAEALALVGVAGACSVVAWLGIVNGYRGATPSVLAPLEYSTLAIGAAAGYLIWDEVPDAEVIAGACLIIASGLYVVYREVKLRQRPRANETRSDGAGF